MPNTTQKESLSPAEPLQRAHSDPGYSRENEYKEGVADETPTEKDSSYDGTDSDAESMSSNILHNFAEWKARLKREAAAELNLSSPDELSSANLRHFTRALHPECPIEDDGYESEDESEEDLDENGRPIARLTKVSKSPPQWPRNNCQLHDLVLECSLEIWPDLVVQRVDFGHEFQDSTFLLKPTLSRFVHDFILRAANI